MSGDLFMTRLVQTGLGYVMNSGVVFTAAALEDGCDRLVVRLSPQSPPLVQDAEF